MTPASSDTGFAQGRTGGYGRVYGQTADLADEADNESQKKEEFPGCFKKISLIRFKASKDEFLNFRKRKTGKLSILQDHANRIHFGPGGPSSLGHPFPLA